MITRQTAKQLLFAVLVCVALLLQGFFFANMLRWRHAPDKGWATTTELGPKVIGVTFPLGEKAGLRIGDRILTINGKAYETFNELITLLDFEVGHTNVYELSRDGATLTLSVTNQELGFQRVAIRSGLYWLLGIIFIGIGVLVFLMKPYYGQSWAFLSMSMLTGIAITYSSPSSFLTPAWLSSTLIFCFPLLAASIFHLTILFPQRRAYADHNWCIIVPYLASLTLAIVARSFGPRINVLPVFLLNVIYLYLFASLVLLLGSTLASYRKSTSVAVRLQSLVVLSGIVVALFIPLLEMLSGLLLNVSFFPNPVLFYMFFLIFFPLSIGYAIVRHDLFEINTIVRRTYGYVLSTAAIVGAYALLVSGLNATLQSTDVSGSPLFSISFALGVIFLFDPLHRRFQGFIDRIFYRQQYDYRKAITRISETMTSLLDPELIHRTLIGSVAREMFLENSLLFLPNPAQAGFQVRVAEGVEPAELAVTQLGEDDILLRTLQDGDEAIFRHDLDLHPRYEQSRETLQRAFQAFASELMLPMKYKDEIRGVISLGGKKSGKMFTLEDLDLLKTLTNQSVIAMENARLFEENLEKGRMEEELKIAHDIQVSMLPEQAPQIPGVAIAASSIAAREVGGDFYDFIEIENNGGGQQVAIVVGDVSGKAVSGALVMAASRSVFRVLADSHASIEDVMTIGNVRLNRDIKKGMFVALLYAVLDPANKTLVLSNAGQTQPILCPADQSVPTYIDTEGDRFPLGIVKNCHYQETQVGLKAGDTVVFYTDGVVEAMNGQEEMYGFDRFMLSIQEGRGLSPAALLEKLMSDVERYVGSAEQHDDLTIVVARLE